MSAIDPSRRLTRRQLLRLELFAEQPSRPAPAALTAPVVPPWKRQVPPPGPLPNGTRPLPQVARVLQFNCIARTGCVSCVEHCPIQGAIRIDETQRVTVASDLCDGCGRCREVCAAPTPALEILPRLPGIP